MTVIPDWLAALGIVVPALTGLGGYWLAGRNEESRDRRLAAHAHEARRAELAERLTERRHDFQLDLLLELQTALLRQTRATARVILQDQGTLRNHGQLFRLPADINQESYDAGVDLGRLQVRLLDDALRQQVQGFHHFTAGLEVSVVTLRDLPADEAIEHLERQMRQLADRFGVVNESLGSVLRMELGRTIPEAGWPGSTS